MITNLYGKLTDNKDIVDLGMAQILCNFLIGLLPVVYVVL